MSLDDRCQQFHEAALGTGKSKGPVKEIATLRKFLHKNQNQRFTDKGVSRLFDTIQIYVNKGNVDKESKEGLLEDSLKMPFTVFSTKQKKTMIKWLEDLRGAEQGSSSGKPAGESFQEHLSILSVIELEGGFMTLMLDDTGDTFEKVAVPEGDVGNSINKAFKETEGCVSVEAYVDGDSIERILRILQ
jgi:hypothetical protein